MNRVSLNKMKVEADKIFREPERQKARERIEKEQSALESLQNKYLK